MAEQPGLPPAVAAKRMAILKAATACDYEALAALADAEQFTFSFGGAEDAAAFSREGEDGGYQDLRYLVLLLTGSFRRCDDCMRPDEEVGSYVWPRAGRSSRRLESIPQADIDALRPLYDDDDFAGFERFGGGDVGHRIFIRSDGAWMTFVAGD